MESVSKHKQQASAHMTLIVFIVLVLIGVLGYVYWKKFNASNHSISLNENRDGGENETNQAREINYKTYTSPTDSGLSFTYPDTWTLLTTDGQVTFPNGSKLVGVNLYNEAPLISNGDSKFSRDHMCVTLQERTGTFSFSSKVSESLVPTEEFEIGQAKVSLVIEKNSSESGNYSMKLLNQEPNNSKYWPNYIALNNEHYLLATAQKNCLKGLSRDLEKRELSKEIEQAKSILKSIRVVE
jgi:hypothetical protein